MGKRDVPRGMLGNPDTFGSDLRSLIIRAQILEVEGALTKAAKEQGALSEGQIVIPATHGADCPEDCRQVHGIIMKDPFYKAGK